MRCIILFLRVSYNKKTNNIRNTIRWIFRLKQNQTTGQLKNKHTNKNKTSLNLFTELNRLKNRERQGKNREEEVLVSKIPLDNKVKQMQR